MADIKKAAVDAVKKEVMGKIEEGQKVAEKEVAKVKKQFNAAVKSVEGYVKKNPQKAALVAAGVAAALGAALTLLMSGKKKGKR